jgi:hypothetical protein
LATLFQSYSLRQHWLVLSLDVSQNAGTFLTFGGNGWGYVMGRSTVTITAFSNGYGACPCQPIFSFITFDGPIVTSTNTTCGVTAISYSFTAQPGASYSIQWGVWYGSV